MVRPTSPRSGGIEPEPELQRASGSGAADEELLVLLERVAKSVRERRLEARQALEVVHIVSDFLAEPRSYDAGARRRRTYRT